MTKSYQNDYKIAFFLLASLYFLMQISFAIKPGILTDDMMHYLYFKKYNTENIGLGKVFSDYLSDRNRFSRPLSALAISLLTVLSLHSEVVFFFWGILNILYVLMLRRILERYFAGNYLFILLCCAFVLFFPLSSANHFSVIMQAVQLVVGLFLFAIILVSRKGIVYSALAGLLILCSLLIYELNFFLIPVVVIVVLSEKHKMFQKIIWSCILPVILFAIYRLFLVKIIFKDYYDYAASRLEFSASRCLELVYSFIKLFTIDFYYLVLQSARTGHFSIADYFLFLAGVMISFLVAFRFRFSGAIPQRALFVILLCFLLSCAVFILSPYPPVAFGFENRILLWVRYTACLLFVAATINFINRFKSFNYVFRSLLFLALASSIGVVLAEKNGWYAASLYDRQLINTIETSLKATSNKKILILEDFHKKSNLVAYETTIRAPYQIELAKRLYGGKDIASAGIVIAQPEDYSLYQIGSKKFNNRQKTVFKTNSSCIIAGPRKIDFPFYILDQRDDKVRLINNEQEFRKININYSKSNQ